MTQDNDTPENHELPPAGENPAIVAHAPKPRRRKLRIALITVGSIIVLLIVLIILLPTIASTGLVREMVLERINANINGKVEISDWSIGWTSGITASGIQVKDANGKMIVQIKSISTKLSLARAIRGKFTLGDTYINSADYFLERYANGQWNVQTLSKSPSASANSPANSASASNQPLHVPDISGHVYFVNITGTIQDDTKGQSVQLVAFNGDMNIPDINGQIEEHLDAKTRLMNQPIGEIKLDGTTTAFSNNTLNLNLLKAAQTVQLVNIDAGAVQPFITGMQLTGIVNGAIKVDADTLNQLTASAPLTIDNVNVTTAQGTLKYDHINIPITASISQGLINLKAPIVGKRPTDQDTISVVASNVPRDALEQTESLALAILNQAMGKSSGASASVVSTQGGGTISIAVDLNAANMIDNFPGLVPAQKGVTLTAGRVTNQTQITLGGATPSVASKTELTGFTGTSDGKPFNVADLSANLAASALAAPTPALTNFTVDVNSPYLTIKGGGQSLDQTQFDGKLMLAALQQQFAFLDWNKLLGAPAGATVKLDGQIDMHLTLAGNPASPQDAIKTAFVLDATNLQISGIPKPVNHPKLALTFDGTLTRAAGQMTAMQNASLKIDSTAVNVALTGDAILKPGMQINGKIDQFSVDLKKVMDEFGGEIALFAGRPQAGAPPTLTQRLADGSLRIDSGTMSVSGDGTYGDKGVSLSKPIAMKFTNLTMAEREGNSYHTVLNNETLGLNLGGSISPDFAEVNDGSVAMISTFGNATISNAILQLKQKQGNTLVSVPLLDMVRSLHLKIDAVDVSKLDALKEMFSPTQAIIPSPVSAAAVAAATPPLPPLTIPTGVATVEADVARQGNQLTAKVGTLKITGLSIARGDDLYKFAKDVTASLDAAIDVNANAPADATIAQQLGAMKIAALSGDLGPATISLPKGQPIDISAMGDQLAMGAAGSIDFNGDVAGLSRLLEVLSGKPANSFPYQGSAHLNIAIAKDSNKAQMKVTAAGQVAPFTVLTTATPGNPSTVAMTEKELDLSFPLIVNFSKTENVRIDPSAPASIIMKSSGALALTISGGVIDMANSRNLSAIKIIVNYDLGPLWKVIYPLLSPSGRDFLKDAVASGKAQREFNIQGSFPANVPFETAIQKVEAWGSLAVPSFSSNGLTITNLDLPMVLQNGHLRTVDRTTLKPAVAAGCNNGTFNPGLLNIDLTQPVMTLTMGGVTPSSPQQLFKNVKLNAYFAASPLGKLINNPALDGATDGILSVSVNNCKNVPMSALAMQNVPDNHGVVDLVISATGLNIGNPIISQVFSAVGGRSGNAVQASLNNGTAHFEHAKVTEDMTLLVDNKSPLRIFGTVSLATRQIEKMTVSIPSSLMGNLVSGDAQKYLPPQVDLAVTGSMDHPKVETGKTIENLTKSAIQQALVNTLTGKKNNGGATSKPSPEDLLKGLFNH